MKPASIADFFAAQGHTVIRTASCWWYNQYHQQRVYYAFPYYPLIAPSRQELAEVFGRLPKAVAVRFLAPPEGRGKLTYRLVCRGPYELSRLSSKSRNQTRRGLERCVVRPMNWDELVEKNGPCAQDTQKRHGASQPAGSGCDTRLKSCSAYEAWGAFVQGELAAYLVAMTVGDCAHILVQQSRTDMLGSYSNNALAFAVVKELLSRPEVVVVDYGEHAALLPESLTNFKMGMGFEKESLRQCAVMRPWLGYLAPLMCGGIKGLARIASHSYRLRRLAGFCEIITASR